MASLGIERMFEYPPEAYSRPRTAVKAGPGGLDGFPNGYNGADRASSGTGRGTSSAWAVPPGPYNRPARPGGLEEERVRTLILGVDVPGYASLLVAILFLGSLQLLSVGLLGEYIGRIYDEVKRRPRYIVDVAEGFAGDRTSVAERAAIAFSPV